MVLRPRPRLDSGAPLELKRRGSDRRSELVGLADDAKSKIVAKAALWQSGSVALHSSNATACAQLGAPGAIRIADL